MQAYINADNAYLQAIAAFRNAEITKNELHATADVVQARWQELTQAERDAIDDCARRAGYVINRGAK